MNDMRQGTCPLCGHNEIIQAIPTYESNGNHCGIYLNLRPSSDASRLHAFACRRCSFTQLFVEHAPTMVVAQDQGSRIIVGPPPAGPFR